MVRNGTQATLLHGQTTYHELFQGLFKELIVDTHTARVFHGRQWILDHVFDIKINVDLLQRKPHAGTFEIGKHDEFDIGRGLVVVQLVLIGTEGDKTGDKDIMVSNWLICPRRKRKSHLSSSPPSLRTIFRREKTVPKMSFASSSVVRANWPKTAGTPVP